MKGLKKLIISLLALVLAMGASITAFAGDNSITIENAYKGETYKIYKMLDLDVKVNADDSTKYDGYSYTVNQKWRDFWNSADIKRDYVDLHVSGDKTYVVWKSGTDATTMAAFGALASAYANGIAADYDDIPVPAKVNKNDPDTQSITFEGLDNGYYMITSTLGTAVTIGSTPTNVKQNIMEKNSTTTTEKKVLEAGEYDDENDAQIGDTVSFRSKVSIAKNSINVKYHDTMTEGLTWDDDSVKVYTTETLDENSAVPQMNNWSVEEGTNGETFVVTFENSYVAGLSAATTDLYIAYTAKLNDNAQVATTELNTPAVTYGNGGKFEGTPTQTTTHKFEILKYDGADAAKNPLAGAKFQLFEENATTPLTLAVSSDGYTYRVVHTGEELPDGYDLVQPRTAEDGTVYANEITTLASRNIVVEGVDSRNYELLETEAPLGFNKLDKPKKITVDANNNLVAEVENLSGSVLPSTGGVGTTIFYILGGILIVAGVAYFIVRRKASAE